ncbi:glutamine--fructose-6-phosphate transaminase (isomerizing) [Phocaeicola paurosaccharolyticus]|uniref:glutamine--fructose-6-phosphate transaminase (isomerizing) n=1 Tax=Phocaeicola paurosaccharolyticus TaxID=732242 RepID=UPI00046A167A|nr:glutamine--fructose-6-phosphate transaminase (isomerizing) [Phocaeicola paurosaccharolyticus]
MCGIVGYIGKREAYPILIKGLHRLEYRGYDSAGVAIISKEMRLNVLKAQGKVSDLENAAQGKDTCGSLGIAHTRWATHGIPSQVNAHPHLSQSGEITLVHNGIIENYATLRAQLLSKGYTFKSQTDTEVLVQLIEYIQKKHHINLTTAVRIALNKVIGAYAIVVIDSKEPDLLVVARKSSPLVIGVGEGNNEFFVGSDASPIAEYTKKMIYLKDDEVAELTRGEEVKITTLNNDKVDICIQNVEMDLGQLDKSGYAHFMLKEIFDQPDCITDCMRGRLLLEYKKIVLSAITDYRDRLLSAKRFIIVSCGTSWHAGLIGKQLIEEFCRIPVHVEYASEFRYRNPVIFSNDVVIAISQSGETADTLAAIELAKKHGAMVFGVVNAVGSSIARNTDTGIYTHVGPEIGVASTKAFTGQVTVLTLLASALAKEMNRIDDEYFTSIINELSAIPDKMRLVLQKNDEIEVLSKIFTYAHNFLYLGRGWNYPVALEGALKLKEISYIHAEGYPAAEMKHGPIALVDSEMPVVFIAPHHELYKKIISNMQEVKARNGNIIAIVTEGDTEVKQIAKTVIEIPNTLPCLTPLLTSIPLQLLAYHVAVQKGLNVDQPRNLAKSVTVE